MHLSYESPRDCQVQNHNLNSSVCQILIKNATAL